jgi:hypothetical protein
LDAAVESIQGDSKKQGFRRWIVPRKRSLRENTKSNRRCEFSHHPRKAGVPSFAPSANPSRLPGSPPEAMAKYPRRVAIAAKEFP